jgi:hypothetical protein
MKLEHASIDLVPRATHHCLDLAFLFLRRQAGPVAAIWTAVCLPAAALLYLAVDRLGANLLVALAWGALTSTLLGTLLLTGIAPSVFGEPFTARGVFARLRTAAWWKTFLIALGIRLAVLATSVLCLPLGMYVRLQWAFALEQRLLANLGERLHDHRIEDLLRGRRGDLFGRALAIGAYAGLLWWTLFWTLDFGAQTFLGAPILYQRVIDSATSLEIEDWFNDFLGMLWNDPRVLTALFLTALFVYPLARLAWFFCYIDLRVRRDCWDLELRMTETARLLEST